MDFPNKTPAFLPGTVAPTNPVAKFVVTARIRPAQGGFAVTSQIVALDASGKPVNPPAGFVIPDDVQKAYQLACIAALDACASVLVPTLEAYGYNP